MIIYSTRIPMKKEYDREAFLSSILKWNSGGHYRIAGLEEQIHSHNFEVTDGENSISSVTLEDELTTAVRVRNENRGGIWNTDLILNEDKNVLTVCVDRSVQDTTELIKGFASVPGIVRQLIADGYAGTNLGFPISETAIRINAENKSALDTIISGESAFSLPLVYLSSRSKLDADKLAGKLTGLATVIQDDEDALIEQYPEPIYIFFPHKNLKPRKFGDYPLHRDISFAVIEYLNSQVYAGIDTWNGIKNAILDEEAKKNAEKYQEAASENEVLSEMQEEYLAQERNNKAERDRLLAENSKLQAEVFALTARLGKLNEGQTPILNMGVEKDYYEGENLEIVIEILKEYYEKRVGVDSETRRHDILKSILDANPAEGIPEKFRQIIKNAFEGYKGFESQKIRSALRETGIEIVEHTKHYKLEFHGDPRYQYETGATPSDFRAGINCSSEINRKMF